MRTILSEYFGYFAILGSIVAWAAIGLLYGRHVSGWFPFLTTKRFYLSIGNRRLQKLLIGDLTLYWGRTQPKNLPAKYYCVSPENRGKMCLWGILFYAGWLLVPVLAVLGMCGKLPGALGELPVILFLGWPLLMHGLGNLDYSRGFVQAVEKEKQNQNQEP